MAEEVKAATGPDRVKITSPAGTTDIQIDLGPTVVPQDEQMILREFGPAVIQQRKDDGYWNATAMCQANGKEFSNYHQIAKTEEFVKVLESVLGIPRTLLIASKATGPC